MNAVNLNGVLTSTCAFRIVFKFVNMLSTYLVLDEYISVVFIHQQMNYFQMVASYSKRNSSASNLLNRKVRHNSSQINTCLLEGVLQLLVKHNYKT